MITLKELQEEFKKAKDYIKTWPKSKKEYYDYMEKLYQDENKNDKTS